jgi:serine/threonine protein kinase
VEAELRDRLQISLGGAYTLERELGGGMARVFVAEETNLGRKVVVKVLPPELAAEVTIERFRREIQFAAQLQRRRSDTVTTTRRASRLHSPCKEEARVLRWMLLVMNSICTVTPRGGSSTRSTRFLR